MSALENLLKDKTLPFFDGDNKMTFLEYAIWFTNRGTNAMDMEKAAEELAALKKIADAARKVGGARASHPRYPELILQLNAALKELDQKITLTV